MWGLEVPEEREGGKAIAPFVKPISCFHPYCPSSFPRLPPCQFYDNNEIKECKVKASLRLSLLSSNANSTIVMLQIKVTTHKFNMDVITRAEMTIKHTPKASSWCIFDLSSDLLSLRSPFYIKLALRSTCHKKAATDIN